VYDSQALLKAKSQTAFTTWMTGPFRFRLNFSLLTFFFFKKKESKKMHKQRKDEGKVQDKRK